MPNLTTAEHLPRQKQGNKQLAEVARLRTDFDPVRQLCLVYPAEVSEPEQDYDLLTTFYEQFIPLVPADIEVILLVKSRQVAAGLRHAALHPKVRLVVNSELRGIWLRDYAGFTTGTRLMKPTYKPGVYWGDYGTAQLISENMKSLHSVLDLDLELLDLIWDGGNLVTNGRYAFISEQLLKDNKKRYPELRQVEALIQQTLGVEPIWVKLPAADKLSHTDGYLAFIAPDKALVSTFPETWAQKYPEDQQCVDALTRQVQDLGIEVERIEEQPQDVDGTSPIDSAVGIYVNLLQLNDTWLVPAYGLDGEQEMQTQLKRLNPDGTTIPIDCTELARLGGVLHCISFCN